MRHAILIAYSAIIGVMLLFPPTTITVWTISVAEPMRITFPSRTDSGGFRFIGSLGAIPDSGSLRRSISMDYRQLAIQIVMATLAAGATYLAEGHRKKLNDKEETKT
jgi:hypothetical protein